ncbi:hypothetical protein ACFO9Q_03325 [Paenibacillus sp. GCM10023252]|uniref:hypothetical protein n=1 Tax=Paenibacillus sp. GCM10023252 TaxID=3252649 RepID=UPI00361CBC62
MQKWLASLVIVLVWLSLSTGSADRVYACSCGPASVEERYEGASAIFTGTVVSRDAEGGNIFKVDKVWKGDPSGGYVHSGFFGMCGTEFEEGKKYLVYTYAHKGVEHTDLCSGNKLISKAGNDMKALDQVSSESEQEWTYVHTLIVGGLVLIRVLVARKRPRKK